MAGALRTRQNDATTMPNAVELTVESTGTEGGGSQWPSRIVFARKKLQIVGLASLIKRILSGTRSKRGQCGIGI